MKHVKLFETFSLDINKSGGGMRSDDSKVCIIKCLAYGMEEGEDMTYVTIAYDHSLEQAIKLAIGSYREKESLVGYYGFETSQNLASDIEACAASNDPEEALASLVSDLWEDGSHLELEKVEIRIIDASNMGAPFVESFGEKPMSGQLERKLASHPQGDSIKRYITASL
jgi:hypothetical protein